jgi:hypothetical protein
VGVSVALVHSPHFTFSSLPGPQPPFHFASSLSRTAPSQSLCLALRFYIYPLRLSHRLSSLWLNSGSSLRPSLPFLDMGDYFDFDTACAWASIPRLWVLSHEFGLVQTNSSDTAQRQTQLSTQLPHLARSRQDPRTAACAAESPLPALSRARPPADSPPEMSRPPSRRQCICRPAPSASPRATTPHAHSGGLSQQRTAPAGKGGHREVKEMLRDEAGGTSDESSKR